LVHKEFANCLHVKCKTDANSKTWNDKKNALPLQRGFT